MNILYAENLACPIDKLALTPKEGCFQCTGGHSFDIAKQGYINLLPVQHKKSREPGDSRAMVQSRNRFLNAGFYEPIASNLSKIIFKDLDNNQQFCILDAGCGEGYYLDQLIIAAQERDDERGISFTGMDISKPAIIAASKRNKQARWIVGTNSQPPFLAQTVDLIFCIFGFHSFNGFKRILKPGGKLILVEPGNNHLQELREIIYSKTSRKEIDNKSTSISDFTLKDTQPLKFKIELSSNRQILDLLSMTPHLFRASTEGKSCIENMDSLSLTTDIIFRTFEFNPATNQL